MLLLSSGIDENVVNEDYDKLIEEGAKNSVHVVHEHYRSIVHIKRHNHILVVSIPRP